MSNLIGKQVILTLKRSTICTVPKHKAFVQTLALKKVGDTRECEYTPNVHGMVKLMPYLVDVKVKG
ncbi:uL30 family ribosomal protein [Holophaga foetida]|uniref:uL30 family ribosomal protein n=1 Tax=Holophaga foetida TaxID=35839 RepID=UPI00024753CE|nr:uL30 family ribosomal protein [Holophaga foetida]